MLSAPAPSPPPVSADSRIVGPSERWKADLRKRIKHDLRHMVEEAQTIRDAILNSQPPESSRERAQREFEEIMNNVRSLARERFNSQLRLEMIKRKWVDSNSPEVVRQQQWILTPFTPHDVPQGSEGGLFIIPRQQDDSERGSNGSFKEEEGEEDRGEWDTKTRQSPLPSRPNTSLIQALHSKSPVSRKSFSSRQRQPSSFLPGEDDEDEDAEDPQGPPVLRHGGRPFPPGAARRQSSGSQASVWRSASHTQGPSDISRTFAYANGQTYNPGRSSLNSAGSTSSSTGLHRAGPLNDQYRSSSVALRSSPKLPPAQNRDRVAPTTGPRERQTSASASP